MVIYIKRNLILNSDNICYAKIVADERGFTNKMQINFIGGENIEVELSSVENCKKCFEHIASAIQGYPVQIIDASESESETKLPYNGVHIRK